jgi:phosphoglycolate phosphatase-like HAD superfamily hydrolase
VKSHPVWAFDLDGTLVDSGRCVVAAAHAALEANGLPSVLGEQIIRHMGRPLDELFRLVTSNRYDDGLYAQLIHAYRDSYSVEGTTLFPGIPELLTHLTDSGSVCAIATSKRTDFARRSCDLLGIAEHFTLRLIQVLGKRLDEV